MPEGDQEQQNRTFKPEKGLGEPSKEPSPRERISKYSFLRLQELIENRKEQARQRGEEYREEGAGDPLIQRRAKLIEEWMGQNKPEFDAIKLKASFFEKLRGVGRFKDEKFSEETFKGAEKVASELTEEDLNKDPNSPYAGIREYMFKAYLEGVEGAVEKDNKETAEKRLSGQRQAPEKPFTQSWVLEREDELADCGEFIQRLSRLLHTTPGSVATQEYLVGQYQNVQKEVLDGRVPEAAAALLLARIAQKIEELDKVKPLSETVAAVNKVTKAVETQKEREEPEIEKIPFPETAGKCVKLVEDRLFGLLQKAIVEKKQTKDYVNDYKAIERFIERLSDKDPDYKRLLDKDPSYKGVLHEDLSRFLFSKFPEGVYLKEKLTLLVQAMRNLTDRTVEVINAEGSLMKLGVEKPETPLAKEMLVTLTNIEPMNWYVLTRLPSLFPEAGSIPETKLDIQAAWNEWRAIGDRPYGRFRKWVEKEKDKKDKNKGGFQDDVLDFFPIMLRGMGKLIEKDERLEVGQVLMTYRDRELEIKWEEEKKEEQVKAKTEKRRERTIIRGGAEEMSKFAITLPDIYQSEAVELMVRNEIAKKIGNGLVSEKGVRSELLTWCFLKVGLTFDMWDRERWKIKADMGARDLIWFPFKQMGRMMGMRTGEGVTDTAGSYWALEEQGERAEGARSALIERLGRDDAEKVIETLKRNEQRAVFLVKKEDPAIGTIAGDFWTSTRFGPKDHGKNFLNMELKDMPFLDPRSQIEEGTYSSYFSYSLALAKAAVESMMKTGGRGWEVDEFKSPAFWKQQYDLFYRLGDYCPWVMLRKPEKQKEIVLRVARTFARGIFWLGSYKAQPYKEFYGIRVLPRGVFSFDDSEDIKRAIKSAGFLDDENYRLLVSELREFKFFQRGTKEQTRRRR